MATALAPAPNLLLLAVLAPLVVAFGDGFIAHLRHPQRFDIVLESVGARGARPLIIATEGIVLVLLLAQATIGGAAALAFLLTVTAGITVAAQKRGRVEDCGCGSTPKPVARGFFVRNGILALCAIALIATALV